MADPFGEGLALLDYGRHRDCPDRFLLCRHRRYLRLRLRDWQNRPSHRRQSGKRPARRKAAVLSHIVPAKIFVPHGKATRITDILSPHRRFGISLPGQQAGGQGGKWLWFAHVVAPLLTDDPAAETTCRP